MIIGAEQTDRDEACWSMRLKIEAAERWEIVDLLQGRLVHRLDRAASGALVVALTADAAAWLSAAFRAHADQASGVQGPQTDHTGKVASL